MGFEIHEALDQSGALIGPLIVASMIAWSGYRGGFVVLAIPGAMTLLTLAWLHRAMPQGTVPPSLRSPAQRPNAADTREISRP